MFCGGLVEAKKGKKGARKGLELFAGTAGLTKAHESIGVQMHSPVDILYGRDVFDETIDSLIKQGHVSFLWLAPPCSSFSCLRNLDRGGPLRPKGCPAGDESNAEVKLGNDLWRRALYLIKLAIAQGIPFDFRASEGQ